MIASTTSLVADLRLEPEVRIELTMIESAALCLTVWLLGHQKLSNTPVGMAKDLL